MFPACLAREIGPETIFKAILLVGKHTKKAVLQYPREGVTGSGEGVQWASDGGVGVRLNAAVPYWGQMASIHLIPHAGMSPL